MGERQPLGEMARRFVGRLAVERHHGSGHARHPTQVRPPSIADGHHFDMVRPPANAFFKTMNSHMKRSENVERGTARDHIQPSHQIKRSVARRRINNGQRAEKWQDRAKEIFTLSGSPQVLHAASTVFPHRSGVQCGIP